VTPREAVRSGLCRDITRCRRCHRLRAPAPAAAGGFQENEPDPAPLAPRPPPPAQHSRFFDGEAPPPPLLRRCCYAVADARQQPSCGGTVAFVCFVFVVSPRPRVARGGAVCCGLVAADGRAVLVGGPAWAGVPQLLQCCGCPAARRQVSPGPGLAKCRCDEVPVREPVVLAAELAVRLVL